MNIAIGTFLIFLILIPGIAFRKAFIFGPLTKKFSKTSAADDFVWAIIPGIVIQFSASLLINSLNLFGLEINFSSLGQLLYGENISIQFQVIQEFLPWIFIYNVTLAIFSALLGWGSRELIRGLRLDLSQKFLRFNNEWYYFLRGEYIYFKGNEKINQKEDAFKKNKSNTGEENDALTKNKRRREKFDGCFAYAMVKTAENKCHIYYGYIHSFYLSMSGQLETITLKYPVKAEFSKDDHAQFKEVSTEIIVLKYSEIINIAVTTQTAPDIPIVKNFRTSRTAHVKNDMSLIPNEIENQDRPYTNTAVLTNEEASRMASTNALAVKAAIAQISKMSNPIGQKRAIEWAIKRVAEFAENEVIKTKEENKSASISIEAGQKYQITIK